MVVHVLHPILVLAHHHGQVQHVLLQCVSIHDRAIIPYLSLCLASGCFFGKDRVRLVDGGTRLIEDLQSGDRVWSLASDGKRWIEDEIIMIMHRGQHQIGNGHDQWLASCRLLIECCCCLVFLAKFYTMTLIDGNELSLTDRHYIPVFDVKENRVRMIRSSGVSVGDELLMYEKRVSVKTISVSFRAGFYSPLTLSGYLMVNNISTSIYSDR